MATDVTPQVRAGCYLRISSDPKDKRAGVDRQREDTAALCEVKGWELSGYYEDNDRSASNGKARPEWDRLLGDIAAGEIDAIVVWNQDRGWRMMSQLEDLRRFFESVGRRILLTTTLIGDIDLYDPYGVYAAQSRTAASELETAVMKVRMKRAARQRAVQGVPKWTRAFGYLPDYQPDPATAPLVQGAYLAVVRGEKITRIAEQWNAAGFHGGTGRPWSTSTLSLFLRSPRNAGLRSHNGEIVGDGTWPGLVDEKLWRAAQGVLNGNRHGPKSVQQHVLTGVMRCGKDGCEGRLAGNWVMQANGTGHAITYSCKPCRGVSVRAEHVEPLVLRALVKRLCRADSAKLLRKKTYDPVDAEKLAAQEQVLLGRLKEINYERATGKLDGVSYYEMKDVINADLAGIERRRQDQDRLRVLDGIPLGTDEAADAVEALSPDRLRKVLDLLAVITVLPVGKGNKVFNRERVDIAWK
jgi:DNA invertase Pin-like site-specific DNA recombinase